MKPLLKRFQHNPAGSEAPNLYLAPQVPDFAPESSFEPADFVYGNAQLLAQSAQLWSAIAQRSTLSMKPESIEKIKEGLEEVYRVNDCVGDDWVMTRDALKAGADLTVWALINARRISSTKPGPKEMMRMGQRYKENTDQNLRFLYKSVGNVPMSMLVSNLVTDMIKADEAGEKILGNMADVYGNHPHRLADLAQLYEDDAAGVDPHFAELRRVVAQDWYRPDRSRSVLRKLHADLSDQPQTFFGSFAEQVEQTKHDKRLLQVKQMAEFAVAALAQGSDQEPSISEVLERTYSQWGKFSDVKVAFDAFVKIRTAEVERAIAAIAGPYRKKDIRMVRSQEEVDEFKRQLEVRPGGSLAGSGKRRSNGGGANRRANSIPSAQDIAETASTAETERKPKQVSVTKSVVKGSVTRLEAVETPDLDAVIKQFKIPVDGQLAKDVKAMIERIKVEPISGASVRLRSKGSRNIDGSSINLWRFAAEDSQGLSVSRDNLRHRVIYGIRDDKLIIFDILNHGDFDKKYV